MGRDTKISIANKKEYLELVNVHNSLCIETDPTLYVANEEKAIKLKDLAFSEGSLIYWGKRDCSLAVHFFRQFKSDDGDLIITKEIFQKLEKESLLDDNILKTIKRILKRRDDLLIIFSTG